MSKNKERSQEFDSLRQRLMDAEQNAVEKDWNVPSDSVWTNIKNGLSGRKRAWLAIIPWFLSGLAFLLALYLWDQNSKLEKDLDRQLGIHLATEDSLAMVLQECQNNNTSQRQLLSMASLPEKEDASTHINKGEEGDAGRTQKTTRHYSSLYHYSLYSTIANKIFPSDNMPSVRMADLSGWNQGVRLSNSSSNPGSTEHDIRDLKSIDALTQGSIPLFWLSRLIDIPSPKGFSLIDRRIQNSKAPAYWSVRLYGGYGVVIPRVEGIDLPTSEALGLNIENGISFGFEGLVRRQLTPKWSISAGISYQDIQARTGYQVDLTYDPNLEIKNANGNFHLDFEHSIPSSAGNISLNFGLLRLANDQIQPGETLPFKFRADQHFHFLGIPLWVHYNVLKGRYFDLELSAGYRLDHLAIQNTVIQDFEVGHARLHNRYAFMESTIEQYRSFSSNLLMGFELGRALSSNLSLQARVRSSLALDPIYRLEGTQSRFFNYDLSLGLAYHW